MLAYFHLKQMESAAAGGAPPLFATTHRVGAGLAPGASTFRLVAALALEGVHFGVKALWRLRP